MIDGQFLGNLVHVNLPFVVKCFVKRNVSRAEYPMRTPLVRLLFCLMAVLMILWDFMLLITVLYFHMMIEKGINEEKIFKRTPS